ncbi:MAG: hypothetical protein EOM03_12615 [Clostridia bacterium]|nr:hypothetical protein [Clostridia bacterium]
MSLIRLAIIESPNPMDIFNGTSEAKALEASCKLMGHEAVSFLVRSRREFQETCNYLSSISSRHATQSKKAPFFIHISSHGNNECVAFGHDSIGWEELTEDLMPILKRDNYQGKFALSISACGSGDNTISTYVKNAIDKNKKKKLPKYIFSILGDEVNWDDALVGWILLYHKISSTGISNKTKVIDAIKKIHSCLNIQFAYKRLEESEEKYYNYPPRENG